MPTTSPAEAALRAILDLWPELDVTPVGRRRGLRPPPTAEQHALALERWQDELTDRQAGAIGRGASPAPIDLDQLGAKEPVTEIMCDLADRVAALVQRDDDVDDPGRWDYRSARRHGAPWACTWLLGALDRGVHPRTEDDITTTARHALRLLRRAVDGRNEYPAGHCTACGTALTMTADDRVIVCPNCRTAFGRQDWIRLRDHREPPARRPLRVNLRRAAG